jgi:CDP-diacylglycerol--glycerol-3-phosphate 3-phosphatidyltransferase
MALAAASMVLALSLVLFSLFLGGRRAGALGERAARPVRTGALPDIAIEFGYWVLTPFVAVFRRLRITPNTLSLLSLPVAVLSAVTLGLGHVGIGGVLLLLAFSLDAWDGLLARETAGDGDAGEVVDATVDRYNDVIVMLGFLYYYRLDLVPWLITGAALVGTVLVSYTRAKGQAFGIDTNFGWLQRHERGLYLAFAAIVAPAVATLAGEPAEHPRYYAVIVALSVVALGTNITAVSRARFVITTLLARSLHGGPRHGPPPAPDARQRPGEAGPLLGPLTLDSAPVKPGRSSTP